MDTSLHGSILGAEFAFARFVLCLLFGIGMLMAVIFWRDDASHDAQTDALFAQQASISPAALGVLLSLVAVLIAGTLKVSMLSGSVAAITLPPPWAEAEVPVARMLLDLRMLACPERAALRPRVKEAVAIFDGHISDIECEVA